MWLWQPGSPRNDSPACTPVTYGMDWRWHIYADMNGDGVISVTDVWLWIKWFYFVPGDAIIYVVSNTPAATFFELGPQSYGNWFSAIVGAPVLLFEFLIVLGLIISIEALLTGKK